MQDMNNENTQPTRPDHSGADETMPVHTNRPIEETVPNRVQPGPTPAAAREPTLPVTPAAVPPTPVKLKKSGPRRWPFVLLGILLLFVLVGAGGWLGYRAAIKVRKDRAEELRVTTATEHFMLGMQAQANQQNEIARQQFEYVIRLDPNFPGAADKLREVMIAMAVISTPTPAPTEALLPTLTPTLDTRPQEEIFNTAKTQFAAQDWAGLFGTIDSLRRIDPKYQAVEIDGMLYVALRYRGVDKILHQANLEGGLYDLALAEQFGPLDVDALGYREWARLYLNGATFWEIDWQRVVEAFEQIYPYFPNMRDSSGLTAIERYRIAARNYGDQLWEQEDYCTAYDFYQKSLNAVADTEVEGKSAAAYLKCYPPTETPPPPLPTEVIPTAPTEITPEVPVEPTLETPTLETPQTEGGGNN